MSRWKWNTEVDTVTEQEHWEELEEEAYREEERYRNRLESEYQLELFPEEEK